MNEIVSYTIPDWVRVMIGLWITLSILSFFASLSEPMFEKQGDKPEHPSRTIFRGIANIIAGALFGMFLIPLAIGFGIYFIVEWWQEQSKAYYEAKGK